MAGTTVWPAGAVRSVDAEQARLLGQRPLARRALIVFLLLAVTVFSRFGINLGTYSLSFSLFAVYGLVAVALMSGNLAISPRRLLIYTAGVAVAIVSFVVNTRDRKSVV